MEVVKGIQIKVARVAAGMTHKDLAEAANVAVSIVRLKWKQMCSLPALIR